MNSLQIHSTLTKQQHKENNMSENIDLQNADTQNRFAEERMAKAEADRIAPESNIGLKGCLAGCEISSQKHQILSRLIEIDRDVRDSVKGYAEDAV